MSKVQLRLCQALSGNGWPVDLLTHLITRCGAVQEDLDVLEKSGVVVVKEGRMSLTKEGRKRWKKEKEGVWF